MAYRDLDKRRAKNTRVRGKAVARNRLFLKSLKESLPCVDCKLYYPSYVMDFDHLRDKTDSIARFVGGTLTRLKTEIDKCELVCSNCHRVRTYSRRGHAVVCPL